MALYLLRPGVARDRIHSGSVRIAHHEPGYDHGAAVPAGDWRTVTDADTERLHPTALVELVRCPLPPFEPDDLAGRRAAATHLTPVHEPLLATTTSPPGQLTTTVDHHTGRRIGMHVDNHDRLPYRDRHHSRRRLAVNLGPGTRYLLVATTDIRHMCRTLYPDPGQRYPHTDDVRRYVADGHPLDVLRIRLDPGDGYIAATEVQPHDGSTADATTPSVIAFWLGHWPARRPVTDSGAAPRRRRRSP